MHNIKVPFNNSPTEGTSATFTCKIEGDPAPDVSWIFNGKPLKDGKRYKISNDGATYTLTLPKTKRDMSGTYIVRAKNKQGTEECSADLTVNLMGEWDE